MEKLTKPQRYFLQQIANGHKVMKCAFNQYRWVADHAACTQMGRSMYRKNLIKVIPVNATRSDVELTDAGRAALVDSIDKKPG